MANVSISCYAFLPETFSKWKFNFINYISLALKSFVGFFFFILSDEVWGLKFSVIDNFLLGFVVQWFNMSLYNVGYYLFE